MSKAILEFTLPEEREEHAHAINAVRYHSAMHEFGEFLRRRYKHEEATEGAYEELEAIRAEWWEISKGLLDD